MVPAIYVDVGPNGLQACVWTNSMSLSAAQILSMELILRPITPYILPMIVLLYPLVKTTLAAHAMAADAKAKWTLMASVVIVWSYFACNLLYALLLIAESVGHLMPVRKKELQLPVKCQSYDLPIE